MIEILPVRSGIGSSRQLRNRRDHSPPTIRGSTSLIELRTTTIGQIVEPGGFEVDDHQPSAVANRESEPPRRSGRRRGSCRPRAAGRSVEAAASERGEVVGDQVLPERDGGRLQDPAAAIGTPDRASPARTRSSDDLDGSRHSHPRHITSRRVPWISTRRAGSVPAARCSPSTFWVIRVCELRPAARGRRAPGDRDWAERPTGHLRHGRSQLARRTSGSDT